MRARRLNSMTIVALCVLAGLLALGGSSAQGMTTHDFLFQFGEIPASSGAAVTHIAKVERTAVDSGHVWMSDGGSNGEHMIDEYDATDGQFISQPVHDEAGGPEFYGLAIGHVTGQPEPQLYVAEFARSSGVGSAVGVYTESGTKLGSWTGAETPAKNFGAPETFEFVSDLAFDGSKSGSDWAAGDVYVSNPAQKVIDVFHPDASGNEKYVTQLTGTCATPASCTEQTFSQPFRVAVDSTSGNVFVMDKGTVDIFEPTTLGEYAFVRRLTGTPAGTFKDTSAGVASGPSGEIYVADQGAIDQFSSVGVYEGNVTRTPAGPLGRLTGISVASNGDVYIGDNREYPQPPDDEVFGPSFVLPDVATTPASGVRPAGTGQIEATLNGTVNPDKAGEATCQFDYGTSASFGQVAPCSAPVGEGESPVAVHALVGPLPPDTTYYYRLQASNVGGRNLGEASQNQQFTTPGPGLEAYVSDVAATSATFGANVAPNNSPVTYYFQYGTSDTAECTGASCATLPAPPGASVGSTTGNVEVFQHAQGLSPSTTYHYRLVAISEIEAGKTETFYGPDHTLTTQPLGDKASLADGRQWELVSPPDKQGAQIVPITRGGIQLGGQGSRQAAEDGHGIAYLTNMPTEAEPPSNGQVAFVDQVLSVRGPQGWVSRDISVPHDNPNDLIVFPEYPIFSSDLSSGLVDLSNNSSFGDRTLLSSEASEATPYIRREALCDSPATASECYLPVVTGKEGFADVLPGAKFGQYNELHFQGASSDLSRVVFDSKVALLEGAPQEKPGEPRRGIYEWTANTPADESVQLVSLLPSGEGGGPAPGVPKVGRRFNSQNASYEGLGAISKDGLRVFWEDYSNSVTEPGKTLYVRDTVKHETLRLDAPQPGVPDVSESHGEFKTANAEGSKVFFTEQNRLTSDASEGDLYECDIIEQVGHLACNLKDLTPGSGSAFESVVGANEDGSYLYFGSKAVLSANTNSAGDQAIAGADNLYEYHDGAYTFIAGHYRFTIAGGEKRSTAYVSPSGHDLTFESLGSLTGYDNHDAVTGKPDLEVYLYDVDSGRLRCVSCNPTGSRPAGVEAVEFQTRNSGSQIHAENLAGIPEEFIEPVAANLPVSYELDGVYFEERWLHLPRVISDGGRVFFESEDSLVPQDVNGNEDLYEFEPEGVGNCTAASSSLLTKAGGCLSLISSGTSPEESGFLDASKDGNDVFFVTSSRLAPQDVDGARDVYDAHVCSSSVPCLAGPAVSVPPCTSGDACKGAPSPQPESFGAPASATFAGAGNLTASGVKAKSLTRAQKLTQAVRACRKQPKRKRAACVRRARKRYGTGGAHKATRRARG